MRKTVVLAFVFLSISTLANAETIEEALDIHERVLARLIDENAMLKKRVAELERKLESASGIVVAHPTKKERKSKYSEEFKRYLDSKRERR